MLEEILERYPRSPASLIMILSDIQSQCGYLSAETLKELSARLQVPLSRIYSVATFYRVLSLTPTGHHMIRVCTGTACHVRGAALVLSAICRELGIREGETSADQQFTLRSVGCVGACASGPVVDIDGEFHGNLDVNRATRLIRRQEAKTTMNADA